jgi:hypothetical protein
MNPSRYGIDGDHFRLAPEEIGQFEREGYLVLRGFLREEEIAPIEEIFDRFMRGEFEGMGRDFCDMSGPYERRFEDFNIVNAVLPRTREPKLCDNLFERRAASVARQLIGDYATLDYDQFLGKRPQRTAAVFAWHQDLGYWPTGTPDTRTTTCSLALDDATLAHGCLEVVPGSHREASLRPHRPLLQSAAGSREEAHTLTIDLASSDRRQPLQVRRGDITVHNERIIHGSGGNATDDWRRTYVVAHRSRATVAWERSIGFTHSHNDEVQWETYLDALTRAEPAGEGNR